jgi:hypothetical protein
MLCGADAQPECIPYIFISCGIAGMCAEASCVRSGLRWTIDEDEFERSSGEHVSLSGTYPVVAGPAHVLFWNTRRRFSTGCGKRKLQLWIVSCYSSLDPYHFAKILEL